MNDGDIVKEFLAESYENLDRLDQELVELEKNPSDRETLSSVFRTIHTVKGASGFLGFNKLEKVAHVGESLLTRLREGQLSLSPPIRTALLGMVDAVRQMLAEIQTTGQDGDEDYRELTENLTRLQDCSLAPSPPAMVKSNVGKKATLKADESATTDGKPTDLPAAELLTEVPGGGQLKPPGMTAVPAQKQVMGRIGELLLERGQVTADDIAAALQEQRRGDNRKLGEILIALGRAKPDDVSAAQQSLEARAREAAAETIRVGISVLDKLMNLAGELVLARNQLLQLANTIEDISLHAVSQRMNLITTELQEEVMKTRMQPIGNVWQQFPRTVRDVAISCGKEVEIEMEGKDTELDKSIIEAIKDPLTHLVRNAVDHGIESPQARRAAGKSPIGRLILRAYHEGGRVNIEISDDGAGLNKERIRLKAVERGVITGEQASRMSEREIFNLIFLPGFSTAAQVTNVSGRGVGMDVVKTNVERIGGAVDVQSTPGQGTTVRVKIPLTLAIIPALIVSCSGDRYVIPQVNLLELVRLASAEAGKGIELVQGAPVYRLRGRLLPLVYLDRELKLSAEPGPQAETAVNIVVLQADERQFGLVVDQINDTEEIVVKPLRRELKAVNLFAGSSIMGDGRVALILDVLRLAQHARVLTDIRARAVAEQVAEATDSAAEKQTFLLFAGPGGSRMAIPLSMLARLEDFPISQVEVSGTQWVTQYRGQILPLIRLSVVMEERRNRARTLLTPPASDTGTMQVLVLNHEGRSFGLVVERILDIVEDRADIRSTVNRPAVLYSAVIGNRVTELLDIPAVLRISDTSTRRARIPAQASEVAN